MAPSAPLCYNRIITKRGNMDKQEQVIILARLTQIKDMQIFLLKEELKLKEELSRLKDLEEERTKV